MSKKNIPTPHLDNFLYEVLYNASRDEMYALPNEFKRVVVSEAAAKRFCRNATLDKKLKILTLLGHRWFLGITPDALKLTDVKKIAEEIKEGGKIRALDEAVKRDIFVLTNKTLINSLVLLSDVSESNHYSMGLVLKRDGFNIKKWSGKLDNPKKAEFDELYESFSGIASLFNKVYMFSEVIEDNFGISRNEIEVLLYVFSKGSSYVDYDIIAQYYAGMKTKTMVTRLLTDLVSKGLLEKNADNRQYRVTAMGMSKISQFIKKVIQWG